MTPPAAVRNIRRVGRDAVQLDVLIAGGGIAGLWLLDTLRRRGCAAWLIEAEALGSGQTVSSQGIIHGGLKYTLDGMLRESAARIREMPDVWRSCLAGRAEPDLSAVRMRAGCCYLWRTAALGSRLGMLGARARLRSRPEPVEPDRRPAMLRDCPGGVYAVAEPVVDPLSVLDVLARRCAEALLLADGPQAIEPVADAASGKAVGVAVRTRSGRRLNIRAAAVVLAAGAGNERLATRFGLSGVRMQRRPLHMVLLRGTLPPLHGHCVDRMHTRVTITSDRDAAGRTVWQIGGQVAEEGVKMEPGQLVRHARRELRAVLPGFDPAGCQWATQRIDRAEGATRTGLRPDDVVVRRQGHRIVAWPTKLALAPRLAERVAQLLDEPRVRETPPTPAADRPAVAAPPWETRERWYDDRWVAQD